MSSPKRFGPNYEFPNITPPDVTETTRILAVCGITNLPIRGAPGLTWASPQNDGWFFSDFYLFHHLFQGYPTPSQKWLTCVDPEDLVKKYGQYVHGNPYDERKIVLDKKIGQAGRLRDIAICAPTELRGKFLRELREECNEAFRLNQTVLVLIFAHGDLNTSGIYLGGIKNMDQSYLVTPEDFSRHSDGVTVQITVMSTACYSGGWTVCPDALNITALTAASAENESEPWPVSKSTGRAGGSIYASALIASADVVEARDSIAFQEYTETVLDVLINRVDRFGDSHGISFSSQDDIWVMDYKVRTGAPLNDLRHKWNQLESIPPHYANPSSNRTPDEAQRDSTQYDQYNASEDFDLVTLAGLPGSMKGRLRTTNREQALLHFRQHVVLQGREYQRRFPGKPNTATNLHLEGMLQEVESDRAMSIPQLKYLLDILQYRKYMIKDANMLYKFYNMSGCKPCGFVDVIAWRIDAANAGFQEAYHYALGLMYKNRVFENPVEQQGMFFSMPPQYLAMAMAVSRWDRQKIDEVVMDLTEMRQRSITWAKEMVEEDDSVRVKKRALLDSIHSHIRSPTRR